MPFICYIYKSTYFTVLTILNRHLLTRGFDSLQVNVIHTANPVEHVNNAMVQPNFINPVHHASVDLSGHNLVNAHQASGTKTWEGDM